MMVATRATTTEAFKHLVEDVFEWDGTSAGKKALTHAGYTTINDLITMTEWEIEEMTTDGSTEIPRVAKKLLLHAVLYYDDESRKRTSRTLEPDDWMTLTKADFEIFRVKRVTILVRGTTTMGMTTLGTVAGITTPHVQALKSSHRRDIKHIRNTMEY